MSLQWLPSDSSSLEGVIVIDCLNNSLWDEDVSSEALEYQERKGALQAIIELMVNNAPAWDGEPATVSGGSAETAIRFLRALPPNRELPKVAPDGEDNILFVWEPPNGNCIVTVQDGLVHLVNQPGTRHVEHIDAQLFRSNRIPVSILHAIPLR